MISNVNMHRIVAITAKRFQCDKDRGWTAFTFIDDKGHQTEIAVFSDQPIEIEQLQPADLYRETA